MNAKLALKVAIRRAGGMRALGRKIGVTHQAISYWISDRVPVEWLIPIEKHTRVGREELRPDLYKGFTRNEQLHNTEKDMEPA